MGTFNYNGTDILNQAQTANSGIFKEYGSIFDDMDTGLINNISNYYYLDYDKIQKVLSGSDIKYYWGDVYLPSGYTLKNNRLCDKYQTPYYQITNVTQQKYSLIGANSCLRIRIEATADHVASSKLWYSTEETGNNWTEITSLNSYNRFFVYMFSGGGGGSAAYTGYPNTGSLSTPYPKSGGGGGTGSFCSFLVDKNALAGYYSSSSKYIYLKFKTDDKEGSPGINEDTTTDGGVSVTPADTLLGGEGTKVTCNIIYNNQIVGTIQCTGGSGAGKMEYTAGGLYKIYTPTGGKGGTVSYSLTNEVTGGIRIIDTLAGASGIAGVNCTSNVTLGSILRPKITDTSWDTLLRFADASALTMSITVPSGGPVNGWTGWKTETEGTKEGTKSYQVLAAPLIYSIARYMLNTGSGTSLLGSGGRGGNFGWQQGLQGFRVSDPTSGGKAGVHIVA